MKVVGCGLNSLAASLSPFKQNTKKKEEENGKKQNKFSDMVMGGLWTAYTVSENMESKERAGAKLKQRQIDGRSQRCLRDKKHVEMKGHRFMFPVRVLEKRRIF